MYVQFSEGFPGIVVEDSHIYIDRTQDLDMGLEQLYIAYSNNNPSYHAISPEYAAGLHAFLSSLSSQPHKPLAIKGQITGPISWGLSVACGDWGAIYDDTLAEAIARHLRLKALWQYKQLSRFSRNVIIFMDEPFLTSLGSAFVSIPVEKVKGLLEETLGGVNGMKGLHCCGNTDWSLVLHLPIDILSFDAYNYASDLVTYVTEVQSFIIKGRAIAWGIIPNDEDALRKESVASLKDRLKEAMAPFAKNNMPFRQLVEQALITPSCGLASLSSEAAEQALAYLAEVSGEMRRRYT